MMSLEIAKPKNWQDFERISARLCEKIYKTRNIHRYGRQGQRQNGVDIMIESEDGIEGIQVDGDYPGKAYHYWQEGLKELECNGVILAICSKNNQIDVEALFAAREMPLTLSTSFGHAI